jgi:hypothetical protein
MVDPPSQAERQSRSPEKRPGLGLAKRGAGRGASCRKKHCETGRSCCRSRTPSFADRVAAAVPTGFQRNAALASCSPKRGTRYVRPRRRALVRATAIRRATARSAAQLRRCNAARALLVLKLRLGTFVARLAIIRIAPETRSAEDLIRGSLTLPIFRSVSVRPKPDIGERS